MAESETHIYLVRLLYKWICSNLMNNDSGCIYSDLPETSSFSKPQKVINQYRPDIFAERGNVLIIGEAKTENDLEAIHSKKQFESYLITCEEFKGESYLIVSVPCFIEPSAKNLLNNLKKKLNIKKTQVKVISKLMQ